MKDLRDAARACGLKLIGVHLEKNSDAIDRSMLVFSRRGTHGHFVVIRPVGHTGKLVQVIDSARGSELVDKADLVTSPDWTGLALIPSQRGWPHNFARGFGVVTSLWIALALVYRHRARRADQRPESAAICARS